MNWKDLINETSITLALLATIAAITIIVIIDKPAGLAGTDLPALAIALAGALAGTKIPRQ